MKNISDEQFRAYFLGKLPEPEAEIFEMECAADARLTEQAQTVERELADDYLRGDLSAQDAELFEANYLTTEARRAKLHVAENLWRIAREAKPQTAAAAAATDSYWRSFFRGNALKLVFGSLVLLLFCGALAFYLSKPDADKQPVAELKRPDRIAETQNPPTENPLPDTRIPTTAATENSAVPNREINKNINSAQKNQAAQKNAPAPKTGGRNQPGPAIFALLPGTLRDAGEQFISIAPSTKNLGLRLKLPEDAGKYRIYRAVVKTAEGDSVFTAPNLKLSNFTIPAEKLENRTYVIFLEGKNAAGEFESIADYSFRVRR